MVEKSSRALSGLLLLTGCASAPAPIATPPCPEPVAAPVLAREVAPIRVTPPVAPATPRIDARDVRPEPAADPRPGARVAIVSQSPLADSIASIDVSGDGRLVIVADGRGALALVDGITGEVRAARSVVLQPPHAVQVEIDARGRRALVLLLSSDPEVGHEVYTWDLVSDELTRLFTSRSGVLTPDTIALANAGGELLYAEGVVGNARPREQARVVRADARMQNPSRLPGDSRLVAGVGFTPGLSLPYVLELDGAPPIHVFGGSSEFRVDARPPADLDATRAIAFRPGGGQVAVIEAEGGLALCSPVDGRCSARVRWQGHAPVEVAYGLGGDCITLLDGNGAQALVDAHTGELVLSLPSEDRLGFVRGACTEALIPRPGGRLEHVPLREGAGSRGLLDAPAALALGLDAEDAIVAAEASASGERIVLAVDGALVMYDVATSASRAVSLIGVPGPVTDVAWSPDGAELFVRREGEVLRASRAALDVIACEGDGPGRALADGTMVYGGAEGCAVYSSLVTTELEGTVVATTPDGRVAITHSPAGFRRVAAGATTVLWPASEMFCEADADCRPSATLTHDGAVAALRIGGSVHVVDLRRARTLATYQGQPDDDEAFSVDHRSLLVASGNAGLDAVDLRTGAATNVVADATVLLGPSAEVASYVVLGEAGRPFRVADARTHRTVPIASDVAGFEPVGEVVALRDGLFFVSTPEAKYLLDAPRARVHAVEGSLLDAVRNGPAIVAAVCRGEELSVLSMLGNVAPHRIGTLGGCSRIRRVVLRGDGTAIAVASGDAAMVLPTPGDRSPLLLRAQVDLDGDDHPIAWVLGGSFDADDAVVEALRVRRAGPIATAPLDPASDHALRRSGVHRDYFSDRGPVAPGR